ncbi:MAG: DUF1295 domain-containing protein [Gammaproteobacteria bacterium]
MEHLANTLPGLTAVVTIMIVLWLISVYLRNVSIIDLFWGPVIAVAGVVYWSGLEQPSLRANILLLCVLAWALRLGVYLFARNSGKPEDRRYVDMRKRNDPGFWWKSLYLVFLLQAVLAWIISFAVYGGMQGDAALGVIDYVGLVLFVYGFVWETAADWQLANFLRTAGGQGKVMDRGVWRYSRHPNYFGEFCLWWGFWLLAFGAGAWWTIFSPLLLSLFLLKVSGVSLLESDISERRPAYADYIRKTSAFIPMPPRT